VYVKISSTIARSTKAAVDYTKPRIDPEKGIDTSGDSPTLKPGPGVIAGGIQGFMAGNMVSKQHGVAGALGGVTGSFAGSAVAQKTNMALGAATGFGVGAATTAVVSAGLTAALGGIPNTTALAITALGGGIAGLSGTLATTPGGQGILSGGIQGYVGTRDITGMAAGSLGGYVGLEVGKATGSTGTAVAAGTAAGALVSAGGAAALAHAFGGGAALSTLAGSAVLGGLAGAVATVSCSRRSAPRDGAYGGMLVGMGAGAYLGNPSLGLATAAAGGFAARAKTNTGKALLGAAGGAVAGAMAGGLYGPAGIWQGALVGAVAAPAGAILGTATRQVMRNAQVDLINVINNKVVDPYLEKHTLSKAQKVMVGAAAGGLVFAPIGLVAGWEGVAGLGTLGAAAGAFSTNRMINKAESYRDAVSTLPEYSAPPSVFANVIASQTEAADNLSST